MKSGVMQTLFNTDWLQGIIEKNDPFQLIADELKRNTNESKVGSLVVITGK